MFMQRKFYKDIFSGDLDVATLTAEISLRGKDSHLVTGKTLISLTKFKAVRRQELH